MPIPGVMNPDIPVRKRLQGSIIRVEATMTLARNVVILRMMRFVRIVRKVRHCVLKIENKIVDPRVAGIFDPKRSLR